MSSRGAAAPSTCCNRAKDGTCPCAAEATCSCGKRAALKCDCERATTENVVSGEGCACGLRSKDACTCKSRAMPVAAAPEVDFTTK